MRRYLAFYGDYYYPSGGMNDFIGDYDTKEDAIQAIEKAHNENQRNQDKEDFDFEWEWSWANIWDTESRAEVFLKTKGHFSPRS